MLLFLGYALQSLFLDCLFVVPVRIVAVNITIVAVNPCKSILIESAEFVFPLRNGNPMSEPFIETLKTFEVADYTYNPQGIKPCSAICKPKVKNSSVYGKAATHDYIQTSTGYPTNLLEIKGVTVGAGRLHPTQKPVELLEYFIRTYSNEGETVLDSCMGSGSTGVACIKTNRSFIGIELDKCYFEIAKDRIKKII